MKSTYTEAFVEQALVKLFSRGDRTIRSIADELNMNHYTLKNWMKKVPGEQRSASSSKEKRPQDWRPEEQLVALHESHGLEGEALQGWCRERGLFAHHLTGWKDAFCADGKGAAPVARELGALKGEIQQLKRELLRKDKALAEAAALLIPCLSGLLPMRYSDAKFRSWIPVVFRRRFQNFSGYSPMTLHDWQQTG